MCIIYTGSDAKIGVPRFFSQKIHSHFPPHTDGSTPPITMTPRTDDRERELTAAPITANEGSTNTNLP